MRKYIQIVKQIDRLMGPLLRVLPAVPVIKKEIICKRLLIIRPGGMGDATLLLPAIKHIKTKLPELDVDILCESRNRGIFDAVDFVNRVMCYHNFRDLLTVFSAQYDTIIDTEQSHFLSSILARFIPSQLKVGFSVNGRERFFHKTIPYDHELYEAEMFLDLFKKALSITRPFELNLPYFRNIDPKGSAALLECSRIRKKIVCVFTGATVDERLWPDERWSQVIDFIDESGFQAVLLGGLMEVEQNRDIISRCKTTGVMNMTQRLSLLETTWLFNRSDLLVSTDSGILHLGVLSNVPTLSLFGSGIAEKWAPRGENHSVIKLDLSCSPCTRFGETPPCPYGKSCMMGIDSKTVIEKIKYMLK